MTFACTTPKQDMIGEANLGPLVVTGDCDREVRCHWIRYKFLQGAEKCNKYECAQTMV